MENTINAAIQIVPRSKDKHIYDIIDEAIAIIQNSGLRYMVTPMETVIEGKYVEVFEVMQKAQEVAMAAGADELLVNIKLHIRKGEDVTFEEKIGQYKEQKL